MKTWWLPVLMLAVLLAVACNDGSTASWSVDGASAQADDDTADDDAADDDVTDDDLCAPVAPQAWPEADLSNPSVVSFDDQTFFTVNGQRFFPLGFYRPPGDAAGLAAYKAEGFNIALTGMSCCDGTELQEQIDYLTLAQDAGVMMIVRPWRPIEENLARPDEELAAELAARSAVGSLFGWYTFDEPGLDGTSLEVTHRAHEVLSTYDPDHPDGLVEQALVPFTYYMDDCAMFMIDPYPVGWMPLSFIKAAILDALEATQGEKPLIGVTQAFSWEWYEGDETAPFRPTPTEMRNMTWQYIVLGATGIIAWNYDEDGYTIHGQPDNWTAYLSDMAEINALMSVILSDNVALDLAAQTNFPDSFDYVVKQDETATWILSVSTNTHGLNVTLDLSALGTDLCVVDYTTGETFSQNNNGQVEVDYAGYQVRILEVR